MIRKGLFAFALLSGLAAPALAQGEKTVPEFQGADASLCKTYYMGIYYGGKKNIGTMVMKVEKSADPGAAYKITLTGKLAFGPMKNDTVEVYHCDASFGLVKAHEAESENKGQGPTKTVTKKFQKDGKWHMEATRDGNTQKASFKLKGRDHWEKTCRLFLCLKLDLKKPGTYKLQGIKWPQYSTEGQPEPAELRDIKITVPAKTKPFRHRGKTVPAHVLKIEPSGDDVEYLALDANKNILAWWPDKVPVKMVGGTKDEVGKDLVGKPASPEEAKVKAVVKVYFEVIFKAKKPDALDKVVDWKLLKDNMTALDPSLKDKTPAEFAKDIKEQFSKIDIPGGKEALPMISGMLKVAVKGDKARVTMTGDKSSNWELKKISGAWKLVKLPLGS